jgi:hypothetical protein
MGWRDVDRALSLNLEPLKAGFSISESAVLLVIAHHTKDSTHETIVGQQRVANELGCDVKTVQRAVGVLTASGVIRREPRMSNGYKTTDTITFDHEWEGTVSRPTKSRQTQSRPTVRPHSKDSESSNEGLKVPAEENTQEITQLDHSDTQRDGIFDLAWNHWPRHESKKKALDKFKRLRAQDVTNVARAIVAHGDAHARNTPREFVPHLVTWLNQERWNDPLPQPRRTDNKPTPTDKALAVLSLVNTPQNQTKELSA